MSVCYGKAIFGSIQPGPLAKYIREASDNGAGNDGLLQRFQLLVYPDPPTDFVNHDEYPDTEARRAARQLFEALDDFDPAAAGLPRDEAKGLHYFAFCDEAQAFFDGWRTDLERRLRSGELSAILQAHLGKYRSLMPALALLFHLADTIPAGIVERVSGEAAARAAAWCDYLEAHARRIYASAYDGDIEPAERLDQRITTASIPNPFTYRIIAQKGWSGLDTVENVRRAVGILEDRGRCKAVEVPSGPRGGAPSEQVWIHPQLLSGARKGQP